MVSLPLGLPRDVSITASLISNLASGPERIGVGFEAAAAISLPEVKPNNRIRMDMTAKIPLRMALLLYGSREAKVSGIGQQLSSLPVSGVPRRFTKVKRNLVKKI